MKSQQSNRRPRALLAAACAVIASAVPCAFAQTVQMYEYQPDRIYPVRAGLGISTQIELSPEEKILDYSTGFSSGWDLSRRDNVFYLKAQCAGMKCIDLMELGGTSGEKIIAVQGKLGNAHSKVIDVDTVVALNTPLAQSSQAFADAHNQQQNQRSQQVNQPVQTQTAPALH